MKGKSIVEEKKCTNSITINNYNYDNNYDYRYRCIQKQYR